LGAVASADSLPANDPAIKTGGPLAASAAVFAPSIPAPAGIITPEFTIESPSGTSPDTSPCILVQGGVSTPSPLCYFENDITTNGVGDTISALIFDALGVDPTTANCGFLSGSPFTSCGIDSIPGGTEFSFNGGSIPFHDDFTLDFVGFPPNFGFPTSATTTPEPGTMALLLAGLGSLAIRRKRS